MATYYSVVLLATFNWQRVDNMKSYQSLLLFKLSATNTRFSSILSQFLKCDYKSLCVSMTEIQSEIAKDRILARHKSSISNEFYSGLIKAVEK